MSINEHEQRFMDFTRFALPGAEVAQELSIPRKARKLDAVFHVRESPGLFGPIGAWLSERPVIFEHESSVVPRVGIRRAQVGGAWMAWRHDVARAGTTNWGTPSEADAWLKAIENAPVVVLVAEQFQRNAMDNIPGLIQEGPGCWCTRDIESGGLVLLDLGRLPAQNGFSYWRLTSRGATPDERERRLEALRTDEHLPMNEREALMEAIAMDQIPTTLEEKRAALNRERNRSFQEGEARGRRGALLDVVSVVAPHALPRLERIEDMSEFEREARLVILQSRS